VFLLPGVETGVPGLVGFASPVLGEAGVRQHLGGDLEGAVEVEAEQGLDGGHLLVAEGGPVRGAGVLFGGRGPADDGAQHDDGRAGRIGLSSLDGLRKCVDVLDVAPDDRVTLAVPVRVGGGPVDLVHVPPVGAVPGRDVLAERDVGVVLDGDVVLIVDGDEVAQLLVPGQR